MTHKKTYLQRGFATLTITMVLLLSITLITVYSARSLISSQKETGSIYRTTQALDAAQAGLNYGMVYLNDNVGLITDGQTVSGTLADGSTYTITYGYQGSSNLINIAVSASSPDGTSTRTVSKEVAIISPVTNINRPAIIRGDVDVGPSNGAYIRNNESGATATVISGGTVNLKTNGGGDTGGRTILDGSISSWNGNINSDVTQNDSDLSGMSDENMQTTYLGQSISSFQSGANSSYSNSSNHNYDSELNGVNGETIWITQSDGSKAFISAPTTIGTEDNPVVLVVDGDLKITGGGGDGQATIWGDIIVTGNIETNGVINISGMVYAQGDIKMRSDWNRIWGAAIAGGTLNINGKSRVNYTPDNLGTSQAAGTAYGVVAGSWKDF